IRRMGLQQEVLVLLRRLALSGSDESRAHISEVCSEHLSREDFVALVEAAGQQQRLVEELADLGDQRKRAPGAGVPASTSGNGNQAVDACLAGFLRVTAGGDVMKDQPAVAVYGIYHFFYRTKAGDHDGDPLLDADRE